MIAVVIVTYSAEAAMLEACVASVVASGDADHVIVVDNGGSAVADGDIELIRMPRNVGFGGGANAGFRRATELGAFAVALLNDDIEVDAGWLGAAAAALLDGRRTRCGAAQVAAGRLRSRPGQQCRRGNRA